MTHRVDCRSCGCTFETDEPKGSIEAQCPACRNEAAPDGTDDSVPAMRGNKGHDVFLSYSSRDSAAAHAVLKVLEDEGVRCWVAPRDIRPGAEWGASIIDAIGESRVMVLLYTRHSNCSQQVMREVERAVSKGIVIVPLRTDNEPLSKNLEYFISASHWLDAVAGPLDQHMATLTRTVLAVLNDPTAPAATPAGRPQGDSPRPMRSAQRVGVGVFVVITLSIVAWMIGGRFIAGRPSGSAGGSIDPSQGPPADRAASPPAQDGARLFRQIQATLAGAIYHAKLNEEKKARALVSATAPTQPAATQPSSPSFVNVPAMRRIRPCDLPATGQATPGATETGPYVVIVDYTHPNGRESLRHTYLGLRPPGANQTIMFYNLEAVQQWAGEGFWLKDLTASKTEIPNGYRVKYSFRVARGWRPAGRIDFETWAHDWDNLEGPHTLNPWQGLYIDGAE